VKVLVVEDEKYIRDLYVEILQKEGWEVQTAEEGQSGYEFMKKGGYDLVLLDIKLPKLTGVEILQKLKEFPPEAPNKKILVLSNVGQDDIIAQCVQLGATGYLIKTDYTPDQIIAEVKKIVYGNS
jgi:CheY-like chemotaxis protein